jgi:hypothetical protein
LVCGIPQSFFDIVIVSYCHFSSLSYGRVVCPHYTHYVKKIKAF